MRAIKRVDSFIKYFLFVLLTVTHLLATVDINSATADDLLSLNGIGKAKSQKIIEYRETNGCFKNLDELANIDGISKNILSVNRANITLGICKKVKVEEESLSSKFADVLLDPVNIVFVILVFILTALDIKTGKDLKSQIISVGVLGTFVGIFIGLQGFNPNDIENSINDILVGLKTAFFTSIVGMSVATSLSILQTLKGKSEEQ